MKVSVSWSGGKDSAMALHRILNDQRYEVVSLHTVFDKVTKRVGMHGVHQSLIEAQATSMNLPLDIIFLPSSDDHKTYNKVMEEYCSGLKERGIDGVVYGDIFLEDLKAYRENQLNSVGLAGVFPLWGEDTDELLNKFWKDGFRTIVCAGKADIFSGNQIGEELTKHLVESLPSDVDVCGENGEFHTFLVNAPMFGKPMTIDKRESVYREYDSPIKEKDKVGFWFRELTLANE